MKWIRIGKPNNYAVALLIVLLATGVRLFFTPWISSQVPFLTFYVAVMLTSWLGGLGPGLLAAGLCTLLANYLFMPPPYQLVPDPGTVLSLAVFVLEAAAIAMISERWKLTTTALRMSEAELRRSVEALRKSEEAFRTIADAAPALVWVCDPDGRNIFVNDSWCKYTGQTREEAGGSGWLAVMHPGDSAGLFPSWERCRTRGESYEGECRYRSKEGTYHWHAFRALPRAASDGRIEAWYGVSVDITARKQAEEQLQRWTSELEHAVSARTGELRHSEERLRALTTELNLTEQRERKRIATELHDHLAQTLVVARLKLSQARHLGGGSEKTGDLLIQAEEALNESLSYTRTLVADLAPPVLHEFGLSAALRWLSEHMRRLDLNVSVDIDQDPEGCLPEDQAILLFQSARELLMNVAKHAKSSDAFLRLSRDGARLRLEVSDNGAGFDVSDASDHPSPSSSKFGLFSIRERMKALGGSFELESAVGKGTTASLVLPLAVRGGEGGRDGREGRSGTAPVSHTDSPPAKIEPPTVPGVSPGALERMRVLLVDDHAMVRQGLRSVLESYVDVSVCGEACNGEEAVAAVGAALPAVVVMDINMPNMNGIEATRDIKARYPHTIVIGLSLNPDGNNLELMKKAGADALLTKEAAVEHLYSAIQRAVRERARPPLGRPTAADWGDHL